MKRLEEQVIIDRQLVEVFEYLIDPSNNPSWQAGVVCTKWSGGPVVVGDRFTEIRELAAQRFEMTLEVAELVASSWSRVRVHSRLLDGWASYRLEAAGRVTMLTMAAELAPRGTWRVAAPMLTAVAASEAVASGERLRALLKREVDRAQESARAK